MKTIGILYALLLVVWSAGISHADLVAHWKLDDGSGTVAVSKIDPANKNADLVGPVIPVWNTGDLPSIPSGTTSILCFNGVTDDQAVTVRNWYGILDGDARTVAAWIKVPNLDSDAVNSTIIGYGPWGLPGERFIFRLNQFHTDGTEGGVRVEVGNGFVTANTNVADGTWHHVAVVFEGGNTVDTGGIHDILIYVDGVLDGSLGNWSDKSSVNRIINTSVGQMVNIGGYITADTAVRTFDGRIDEVRIYDHALNATEIGKLFTISTVLENFDDYEDNAEFLLSWSGGTGSSISLDELLNIMEFTYDCTSLPWQCAAQKTFTSPQNWDNNAWAALQINFRGNENNTPETMSITLSDGSNTATVTNSNPCVTKDYQWQIWDIGLAQFSDAGVDLSNVTGFAIGFGDGVSPGGTGTMYFNDILLYQERCLPEMGPAGDLNADCFVDMQDLAIFLDDWLNSDYSVTASAPQSGNLCAHYEFNETSGVIASDSSANNYDAPIEPDTVTDIWDHSGHNGGCIVLDNRFEVVLPAGVFSGITNEVTIAFRVNGNSDDYPDPVDSVEFTAGPVPIENNAWDRLVWEIDQADSYGGCWNHYAIVKNASAGTIRLYLNGLLVARNIEAPEVMSGSLAEQSLLGIIADCELQVKVDDLHIYNYALSQSEVLYLAAGAGSELIQPLEPVLTNADLTGDGIINLADFAIITQGWLKQQFWP